MAAVVSAASVTVVLMGAAQAPWPRWVGQAGQVRAAAGAGRLHERVAILIVLSQVPTLLGQGESVAGLQASAPVQPATLRWDWPLPR